MDNLEKYIRDNRDKFDDRNPDPAMWDKISDRLPQRTERSPVMIWKWVAAAAVVLALVMSGIVAGMYMNRPMSGNPAYTEFMEAQQYYNVEYNKKKTELAQYAYDPVVDRDLQELDKIYNELSQEFRNAPEPDKTELVNAMIQIYKTRIELLERVLSRIERNQLEKQIPNTDEKVKI